jgi:hypothetical protein
MWCDQIISGQFFFSHLPHLSANPFCPLQSHLHGTTTSIAITSPFEAFCEAHCLKQGMCIQQFGMNHGDVITSLSLKIEVMWY